MQDVRGFVLVRAHCVGNRMSSGVRISEGTLCW